MLTWGVAKKTLGAIGLDSRMISQVGKETEDTPGTGPSCAKAW